MTLVEFLRARLAEDEERARFVRRERGVRAPEIDPWRLSWHDEYDLLCIEPSRALAEVDAKRRIVAEYERFAAERRRAMNGWDTSEISPILAALALPYADHPDYGEEWRP